jgi:hypothetical protein
MLKTAIVGASLLVGTIAPALSQDNYGSSYRSEASATAPRTGAVSEARVSQLKARLRLTADQEPLWRPVEAALRQHARAGSSASEVQGVLGMAMPLIQTLSLSQKRSAAAFARSLGISVASAF